MHGLVGWWEIVSFRRAGGVLSGLPHGLCGPQASSTQIMRLSMSLLGVLLVFAQQLHWLLNTPLRPLAVSLDAPWTCASKRGKCKYRHDSKLLYLLINWCFHHALLVPVLQVLRGKNCMILTALARPSYFYYITHRYIDYPQFSSTKGSIHGPRSGPQAGEPYSVSSSPTRTDKPAQRPVLHVLWNPEEQLGDLALHSANMARLYGGVLDGLGAEVPPSRQAAPSNSRSQPSERPSCRFNCHPRFKLTCQHGMPAPDCKECNNIAAAANGSGPALCAVPPVTASPFASPRQPPGADMASAGSPPRAHLETTNTFSQTCIDVWCPGATSAVKPSALLAPPLSETTPALPAAPSTTSQPSQPSDLDGSGSRSSSSCGSHLHAMLQGGSCSSLLSAASATSTTCTRTETQLLVNQLADAEERNAELEARNASLSRANTLLHHQLQDLHDLRTSLSANNSRLRCEAVVLQERAKALEAGVRNKVAQLERMGAASKQLAREAEELKAKLDQLEASARASPTASPPTTSPTTSAPTTSRTTSPPTTCPPTHTPTDSMHLRAMEAQAVIAQAMQQLSCGHTGIAHIGTMLEGLRTDPSDPHTDPRLELMQAGTTTTATGKGYLPGTPSTWKLCRERTQRCTHNSSSDQQQQQQVAGGYIPTHCLKVTPFHSSQRIRELQQRTFTAAHTGGGRFTSVTVTVEKASKELITITAIEQAARRLTPEAHGPFLAPLQHLVRPCSQVGGPLDVGYDLELVVLYEYCAGGSAEDVVRRAAEAVLQRAGSVAEAAAAGAKWALEVLRGILACVQEAHGLGYVAADLKPETVVYHHPSRGWKIKDCGTAVQCGPKGRVPGRGILTSSSLYAAPEQTQQNTLAAWHGRESDMWAVGSAASKLRWIVLQACRAVALQRYGADCWKARVHEAMGQAGTRLRRLEVACCVKEPSGRATLEKAQAILNGA